VAEHISIRWPSYRRINLWGGLAFLFFGISFAVAAYGTETSIETESIEVYTTETPSAVEQELSRCIVCHQETYSNVTTRNFPHPGALNGCDKCHIKLTENEKRIPAGAYSKESIVFLGLDVEDDTSYNVSLRVWDRAGGEAVSNEVEFSPSTLITNFTNDNTPPLISDLRVEEITGGVFFSAVLTWDTDEPSTTAAEYGPQGEPATKIFKSDQYTTDHSMDFTGLASGKVYIFHVIATDPFGNTAQSDKLRVEINNPLSNESAEPGVSPSVEELSVTKIDGKTCLRWKTNIETAGVVVLEELVPSDIYETMPHYPGFAEPLFTGIDSCTYECHKGSVHKQASHPTGRLSWSRTVRAKDLPLLSGGVMLCTTCHTPHGGGHSYILRKEQTEICISCHIR
jgi:predicted CXXCH cytochrome family protein